MIKLKGKYSEATIFADSGEESAISQIQNMLNSPAITNPVAIMPDFHAGKGSVIGFTMKASEYIIPNIVGVDIGCGMLCAKLSHITVDTGIKLSEIDRKVRSVIPVNRNIRDTRLIIASKIELELAKRVDIDPSYMERSIGTLGGGNHFIEFGLDDYNDLWITIHSGSRNLGVRVAQYHQKRAVDYCKGIPEVQTGLEFILTDSYMSDMVLAQEYASWNRMYILYQIQKVLNVDVGRIISSVHNFIDADGIIRKGATTAQMGEDIVLPFHRQEGIWIMRGKGNSDWNFSAPHGAGRVMSRGEAKRTLNQEDETEKMKLSGVFSSNDPLDESPSAYKSPEEIRKYLGETAEFDFSIKPILNIKG